MNHALEMNYLYRYRIIIHCFGANGNWFTVNSKRSFCVKSLNEESVHYLLHPPTLSNKSVKMLVNDPCWLSWTLWTQCVMFSSPGATTKRRSFCWKWNSSACSCFDDRKFIFPHVSSNMSENREENWFSVSFARRTNNSFIIISSPQNA